MYDDSNHISNIDIPEPEASVQDASDGTTAQHTHSEAQPLTGWYDPYDGTYHYNSVPKDTVDPQKDDKRWPTVRAASFFFLIMLGMFICPDIILPIIE